MNDTVIQNKFGIDFSTVSAIPEDPKLRLPYFTAFKELLKNERGKIKTWHRTGSGGREVIQAHTSLIDESIRHILRTLSRIEPYSGFPVLDEFTLIAVGGYGRGELNPHSDIDLLFLHPTSIRQITDQFIQDAISVLWGMGLEIGHSCRTLKDCLLLAEGDLTIKTSMIETRFLIGNRTLYEKFSNSINKNILKKNIRGFLALKLEERNSRYEAGKGVVFDPEPNIKEGPGGLRDYHTALWATAVRFGCQSLREIEKNDAISPQEVDTLYESVNFSLRVRNELHYLVGKKSDVMTLSLQAKLDDNLEYKADNETLLVEKFMRDYFLHATNIYNFSETIFQLCLHSKRSIRKVISSFTKTPLGHGFHVEGNLLTFDKNPAPLFQQDRVLLLILFTLCLKHNLEPDFQLKRQIRLHKYLLDKKFLTGSVLKEFLFEILRDPKSLPVLRLMHQVEILGQILPEFGQAHCMVNYDFYHRFTADEHALRMIGFLEGLAPTNESEKGELNQVFHELPSKVLLKLSVLLQSMAKQQDPTQGSECSMSEVSERLDLQPAEVETLRFLVENPYQMIETALHQDIHQPTIIKNFAASVVSQKRLNMLYLKSYAELRAVAPGTWTAWKKFLISELYHRTSQYLERPESINEKPQATRQEVYKALHWEAPVSDIENHLNQMPEDYLTLARPEEIALHIRLIRSLQDKPFILNHNHNEEGKFHNLILCCQPHRGIFKILLGVLTAKNANILGAHIYTKTDGIVIVSIQVEATEKISSENFDIWKDVKETLTGVLENKIELKTLLASRTRFITDKSSQAAVIPRASIENPASSPFTQIRIEARDHLGMLFKIAKVFGDFNIQIHHAKISTQGDRGIDVFSVSLHNEKLVFPKLLQRIKEQMISTLLIDKLEDIV